MPRVCPVTQSAQLRDALKHGGSHRTWLDSPAVITSPDNPRVKEVLRLRKARERRAGGALRRRRAARGRARSRAGLTVRATYFAPELLPTGTTGEEVSARVLAKMAYRAEPEGVLAVRRDAAARAAATTRRSSSSPSGSRSPATSARWLAPPTPRAQTHCSSPTRTRTRGTRTRSAHRRAPSSRSRSSSRHAGRRALRCNSRRSPRSSTLRRATPTVDLTRPDRVPRRRRRRRPDARLARARRRAGCDPDERAAPSTASTPRRAPRSSSSKRCANVADTRAPDSRRRRARARHDRRPPRRARRCRAIARSARASSASSSSAPARSSRAAR